MGKNTVADNETRWQAEQDATEHANLMGLYEVETDASKRREIEAKLFALCAGDPWRVWATIEELEYMARGWNDMLPLRDEMHKLWQKTCV